MDEFKLFMKIMIKGGPNTDPWGKPYITYSGWELLLFILAYCVLFTNNNLDQSLAIPLVPQCCNLKKKNLMIDCVHVRFLRTQTLLISGQTW